MWSVSRAASSSCRAIRTSSVTSIAMATARGIPTNCREPGSAVLEYDFMQNAFAAATIVAIVSGLVGYFLVLRGQTFAGHALSHIGFAGATGAVLIGAASVWGLVGFTVAAGIGMGILGERLNERDVAIGVVLSLALGLGLLFLHYYTAFATQATAILFGNVLAVDRGMIATLAVLGAIT